MPDEATACRAEIPQSKEELTKQRFLELVQLAVRACQELETHGLKKDEYCIFGRIMEQVYRLK